MASKEDITKDVCTSEDKANPTHYCYSSSIVELNTPINGNTWAPKAYNPLIARGAFGHVDIALLVRWRRPFSPPNEFAKMEALPNSKPSSSSNDPTEETPRESKNVKAEIRWVSLAAIKTIPNATVKTNPSLSSSTPQEPPSLTREAFSELNALRLLNGHENITPLIAFYGAAGSSGGGFGGWNWADDSFNESPSSLCLAFPYVPIDLGHALTHIRLTPSFERASPSSCGTPSDHSYLCPFHLPPIVVQSIIHDILSALHHVHSHYILHRDVKPGNLYITSEGTIQLGDFGLAKAVPPTTEPKEAAENTTASYSAMGFHNDSLTRGLCTLQYRPPELLLGGNGIVSIHESNNPHKGANGALDVWSAGCVFAELITLAGPLFPGMSVLDQLGRIFNVLGTPNEEVWPGLASLPDWNKVCFKSVPGSGLDSMYTSKYWRDNLGDLMSAMLSLDPFKRPSAEECLSISWLQQSESSWKEMARQIVAEVMIPPSLQVAAPIFFSPPGTKDPLAYAKHYASKLAASRRSFPNLNSNSEGKKSAISNTKKDLKTTSVDGASERWIPKLKSNGLLDALRSEL